MAYRGRASGRALLLAASSLLVSAAAAEAETGRASCPCVEWAGLDGYVQNNILKYEPVGALVSYNYPADYGNMQCKAHDEGLAPMCNLGDDSPAWCKSKWCYVSRTNCDLTYAKSRFFPNEDSLYYSYSACTAAGAASNSFDEWEMDNVDGTTMLMDLLVGYLRSSRTQIEEAFDQLGTQALAACGFAEMCPCTTCTLNSFWNKKVDYTDVGAWLKGSGRPRDVVSCLSRAMGFAYRKVASSEMDAGRIGYQYFADQATGSYVGWPNLDWCPANTYDPRYRPWYAAGTTGPKDVVIVVDVSGSMGAEGRAELAKEATLAILDTLTWKDFASIVLFDSSVPAQFSKTMVSVTDAQRVLMKAWVNNQDFTQGGTSFTAALFQDEEEKTGAFPIIRDSVAAGKTSMCQKVIMFLTDGTATFREDDFLKAQTESQRYDVAMMTYSLGSGADMQVTKRLACDNRGIFYPVADGADLATTMAGYYQYFAEGQAAEMCAPSFVEYKDSATGTQLYAGCLPMYSRLTASPELIGVTCNDINMLGDIDKMKNKTGWTDMVCKMSDVTKQCRALDVSSCRLEKLRRQVSSQSVCTADVPPATCPCTLSTCKDSATFKDAKNYYCDTWIGDACTDAYGAQWGYSAADMATVRSSCPRSCGLCELQDPCPYSVAPSCTAAASGIPSTCRACDTDKVSGVDIEGCNMQCGAVGRVCGQLASGAPRGAAALAALGLALAASAAA